MQEEQVEVICSILEMHARGEINLNAAAKLD